MWPLLRFRELALDDGVEVCAFEAFKYIEHSWVIAVDGLSC